ncbi:MAG: exopolysaccharide biosynthesis polyprenyl glycosylphosphotransferase [Candidatus Paceibacterota bacterium]|jgi:exopolysaccharide biosynthesis polyprenyl glycosylphosphotransferase
MGIHKKSLLLIGDIIVLYIALAGTLLVRYRNIGLFKENWSLHIAPFSIIFILWIIVFYWTDLYRYKAFRSREWLLKALSGGIILSAGLSIIFFYLFPTVFGVMPKTNLLIFSAVSFFLLYFWRMRIRTLFVKNAANTIVLGNTPLLSSTVQFLKENPQIGFNVTEWIQVVTKEALESLPTKITQTDSHLIVVQKNALTDPKTLSALYKLLPLETSVMTFSNFYEAVFEKEPIEELNESWFIEHITVRRPLYDMVKRTTDIVAAIMMIIIFILPSIFIALFIKLSSSGKIIYSQIRIGKNNIPFTLYKFRSMRADAEKDGAQWSKENDNRTTKIGKFLRYTHLDELPQTWNILRGDISLVGPRPERPEFTKTLEKEIPFYNIRHIIRPGFTGHAQVNYRYGASVEDSKEKLAYDIYYIKHRSTITDNFIVLKTVKMIFVKLI